MARVVLQPLAKAAGLDISKLARKADLNYRTVYDLWNNPNRDVSLRTLEKLAAALGTTVTALLDERPPVQDDPSTLHGNDGRSS